VKVYVLLESHMYTNDEGDRHENLEPFFAVSSKKAAKKAIKRYTHVGAYVEIEVEKEYKIYMDSTATWNA